MIKKQVQIGPEFFAKAKNDYENWYWALIREFVQNGVDCKSSVIRFDISEVDGKTHVVVENNGSPMTEEILINKLFALGGSGKNFEGTTGGFGKAKELLYYCHDSYEIHSGSQFVQGSGADYNHRSDAQFLNGTKSSIVIDGDHVEKLEAAVKLLCRFSQFSTSIYLNGELVDGRLSKGSRRKEFDWGVVYTNKSFSNKLIIRMNGIPMFQRWVSVDRCVVVELKGNSDEVLTSNRDGMAGVFSQELADFTTQLAVDKKSALRDDVPRYMHYDGSKLSAPLESGSFVSDVVAPSARPSVAGGSPVGSGGGSVYEDYEEEPAGGLGHEFIIKNETNLQVPDYYCPHSDQFSNYSRSLVRYWGRILIEMHKLVGDNDPFSIGFIFSDNCKAEHENGNYGRVYYLNPAKVVEQRSTYSRSFSKRFKLTDRNHFITLAAHEVVHGLGHSYHDEIYASKFTDLVRKVLDNRKSFNWCFKNE